MEDITAWLWCPMIGSVEQQQASEGCWKQLDVTLSYRRDERDHGLTTVKDLVCDKIGRTRPEALGTVQQIMSTVNLVTALHEAAHHDDLDAILNLISENEIPASIFLSQILPMIFQHLANGTRGNPLLDLLLALVICMRDHHSEAVMTYIATRWQSLKEALETVVTHLADNIPFSNGRVAVANLIGECIFILVKGNPSFERMVRFQGLPLLAITLWFNLISSIQAHQTWSDTYHEHIAPDPMIYQSVVHLTRQKNREEFFLQMPLWPFSSGNAGEHAILDEILLASVASQTDPDDNALERVYAALTIIVKISKSSSNLPVRDSLISSGAIRILVRVMSHLADKFQSRINRWGPQLLVQLYIQQTIILRGLPCAKEALDAGILPILQRNSILVSNSQLPQNPRVLESCTALLETLQGYLVHPCILRIARQWYSSCKGNPGGSDAKLREVWHPSHTRLGEIIPICQEFKRTPLSLCDNPTCPSYTKAIDMKRCSSCRRAHYCSKLCQKAHWKLAHYANCGALSASKSYSLIASKSLDRKSVDWINSYQAKGPVVVHLDLALSIGVAVIPSRSFIRIKSLTKVEDTVKEMLKAKNVKLVLYTVVPDTDDAVFPVFVSVYR
ncbi:hypothetical protein C8J56DRAFT_1025823 [Mycena floridula]|nr:hypothetical protein C8J56DRAFT_1025823 [Mycena floridula]